MQTYYLRSSKPSFKKNPHHKKIIDVLIAWNTNKPVYQLHTSSGDILDCRVTGLSELRLVMHPEEFFLKHPR